MKRILLFLIIAFVTTPGFTALKINRIDPAFWWTGMQEKELQIMVYGPGIGDASVTLDYPGVRLDSIVKAESPNYLFLYLNVSDVAQPGTFDLKFNKGKEKYTYRYTLHKREKHPEERAGFDASDVLYLIMPDRFADGDPKTNVIKSMRFPSPVNRNDPNARHGGDLQGIEKHLDYLQDLGVTAIWLNPVLENDMPGGSYHGYATTDYYKVDPRFGTNEYYKGLIQKCHDRGMKVVMDMIFNHCGSEHIWFLDRPWHNWFNFPDGYVQTSYRLTPHFDPYVSQYDKDITDKGWFVETMPDLNQHNPHLMKYLTQNSIWWIEYAGIDGIRMDTHPYVFFDSMSKWCKDVMHEYPHFNIVGECWYNTEAGAAYWQKNSILDTKRNSNLKSVMDFPLQGIVRDAFTAQTDAWTGLNLVYDKLAMDFMYPDPMSVLTFLDNHDTDRFLLSMPKNLGFFKQAIAFLLTTRGVPQIYYGTEILMHGSKKESDGLIRLDFPGGFPGDKVNDFIAADRTPMQNEAFNFIRALLKWRKGNEVLAKGKLLHFMPTNGLYVYQRSYGNKHVLVIMNGNDREITVTMNRYGEILKNVTRLHDILSGDMIAFAPEMTFGPRALYIFEY
ncbi:glycoside hydrolase family 13 protein [Coprobacter tertius]|uniref:Glycoside hydrolase family 13 protein n=1 Tax=Coprobacter tertius TaxID=2944915 RepID=A0ABT1ME14_9BACT|nr:glycoside hydrolase family 13 protein [Coprobacter tertius]MCP9610879.1 glycoside hydrolase family 13 protein [Coprobacter tertius]